MTAAEDRLRDAFAEVLRDVTYTCSRVWEAWGYNTMSEDDFAPAWEDEDILAGLVAAALAQVNTISAQASNLVDVPAEPRYTMREAGLQIADLLETQGIYSAVGYLRDNLREIPATSTDDTAATTPTETVCTCRAGYFCGARHLTDAAYADAGARYRAEHPEFVPSDLLVGERVKLLDGGQAAGIAAAGELGTITRARESGAVLTVKWDHADGGLMQNVNSGHLARVQHNGMRN